jgi:S-adenosylmethionine:tRNA ribosyltransferase-isomerase
VKRDVLRFQRPPQLQATSPPEVRGMDRDEVRLLVSAAHGHEHTHFHQLHRFIPRGSLLVVNASATLPASLPAHGPAGPFVLNLSTRYGPTLWLAEPRWSAHEPGPLPLEAGQHIDVAGVPARVGAEYPGLPRLRFVRFDTDVSPAMWRSGQPIRYAYVAAPYPGIDAYQTMFANAPGSAEMPSAGRPFTPAVIDSLRAHGVRIVHVVLHTGVSSLEVEAENVEDHPLYPEPFIIPAPTADALNAARAEQRPIIAVGTTVVRALESAWDGARVRSAAGFTRVFIRPDQPAHVVDGLITGLHDPLASHLAMLLAIADRNLIFSGYDEAVREGYLWHEFGDSHLILPAA